MTYQVGKYEYREFCSDFILLNDSLIKASSPKEAVQLWLDKEIKVLAIKEVSKDKARDKAQSKKFIAQVIYADNKERYFHVLQIPVLDLELNPLLKGAKI